MTNWYEDKLEAKRDRLEERADKASAEARAAFKRDHDILDCIPPGQPILVSHHSEKRHRRDLARAESARRKGIAASDKAAELRGRASSVGTAGISSDDPEAVVKLKEKLVDLEAKRDRMKTVNKAYKKGGGGAAGLKACVDAGLLSERLAAAMADGVRFDDKPFASYELTNLGARIRDAAKRIAELTVARATPEAEPVVGNGFRAEEDREQNRLRIYFDQKPNDTVRAFLKSRGFHWSPTEGAWQRQISNQATYVVGLLAAMMEAAK